MVLSGPRPAAHPWQPDKFPGRRQRPERHLDQGRAIAALERAGERGGKLRRIAGTLGGGPKALREPHEIGIGKVAGDEAVAVALLLVAADIPESAVGEDDGGQRDT